MISRISPSCALGATLIPLLLAVSACSSTGQHAHEGLSFADMDPSIAPGENFYLYSNGGWLARTDIPAERSSWSMPSEVNKRNQELLHTLLVEASVERPDRDDVTQKIGDLWATGMNTAAIDAAGAKPLAGKLALIDAVHDGASLAQAVATLHATGTGALFSFGSGDDLNDPTRVVAWSTQGGLSLPDRDYYLRDDERSVAQRAQFVEHVEAMLGLLGLNDPAGCAATILAIETRLAQHSLTRVEMRNPQVFDRTIPIAQAFEAMPNFDWSAFLTATGVTELVTLNQPMPEFFAELNTMLSEVSLDDWKTYLRWHFVSSMAPYLASEFEQEDFRFFGTVLSGTPEMGPRWERVLRAANNAMGEAIGERYVALTFSPEAKRRALVMVEQLLVTMGKRIEGNEWMSAETKKQAALKLDGLGVKIGYPDVWRDWSGLEIRRDSYVGNIMRASEYEYRREIAKVGTAADLTEWGMTPQTLNAYYHPIRNEIVFPAAILQPPFFSEEADDPLNYGAIGSVIGHEITHGFDDSGSQFDAEGKLRNWWTDSDRTEFESRTALLIEQYNAFEPIEGVFVNGELTLGENIADLGGLSIAYQAMMRANEGVADAELDGFTRAQRFFLANARLWRGKMRDEATRLMVNTNPHSPSRFRANGPLRNMHEFAQAFDVEVGPMRLPDDKRAIIW